MFYKTIRLYIYTKVLSSYLPHKVVIHIVINLILFQDMPCEWSHMSCLLDPTIGENTEFDPRNGRRADGHLFR